VERVAETGVGKGAGIARQDAANCLGPSAVRAALFNGVLAVDATASGRIASSTGLEAVAIQCNALGLGAAASHGVVVQRADFQSCRTE